MKRDYILEIMAPFLPKKELREALLDKLIEEGVVNAFFGNQEVGEVLEAFKSQFNTTAISKYDRFAAKRLADRHGVGNIIKVITSMATLSDRQFAPSVNSVSELERKWVSCLSFLKKQVDSSEVVEL